MDETKAGIKAYILKEFLPGESPDKLTDTTPLITGRILDSLASLQLVAFLEDRFGIQVEAHEVDTANLDTVTDIADLVRAKRNGA